MNYAGEEGLFIFQMGTQKHVFEEEKKLLLSGIAIDVG